MIDRSAERKSEAVRLCGELGHWVQHRDRQDECPLTERALSEAEDAALERAALAIVARAEPLLAWMNNLPIDSDERREKSLRAGELLEAARVVRVLKGKP